MKKDPDFFHRVQKPSIDAWTKSNDTIVWIKTIISDSSHFSI